MQDTKFKFRFKDNEAKDWEMTLLTKEPMDASEVESIIRAKCNLYIETADYEYSPVDIFDDICDEYGWDWQDTDYDEIYISHKSWKGC